MTIPDDDDDDMMVDSANEEQLLELEDEVLQQIMNKIVSRRIRKN